MPHCPCSLLKTSFQLLPASRRAHTLYSPLGTVVSPKTRSVAVVNVVDWSAPSRHTLPAGTLPSISCTLRPLRDGRPYSTLTSLPPKVSLEVPRGLFCAAAIAAQTHNAVKASIPIASRFMTLSFSDAVDGSPLPAGEARPANRCPRSRKGHYTPAFSRRAVFYIRRCPPTRSAECPSYLSREQASPRFPDSTVVLPCLLAGACPTDRGRSAAVALHPGVCT